MTYSVTEIIGKTLYPASVPVAIYRLPDDKGPVVFRVSPGQGIGVVYSYINKPDGLYWQYIDSTGRYFYTKHAPGRYSLTAIKEQGGKTTIEKIKEQEAKDTSWQGTVKTIGLALAVALGLGFILKK